MGNSGILAWDSAQRVLRYITTLTFHSFGNASITSKLRRGRMRVKKSSAVVLGYDVHLNCTIIAHGTICTWDSGGLAVKALC